LVLIDLGKQCGLCIDEFFTRFHDKLCVRLCPAVSTNVHDYMSSFRKNSANKKAAMTMCRILFTAHDRDFEFRNTTLKPLNS